MKLIMISIMAMLLPLLSKSQRSITALHIGDKLPLLKCNNVINYKASQFSLSDFHGKVIILDFWATWCSGCVSHLQQMVSFQEEFKDKIQIVLVSTITTGDNKEKVEKFLLKRKSGGSFCKLPIVIGDTVLKNLFPHRLIPHYVWINANGIVCAITDAELLTATNINTVFSKGEISLPVKKDVLDYNKRQPLLQDGNGGASDKLIAQSTLTHYLDGLPSGARIYDNGSFKKVTYLNMPILSLYQALLGFDGNRVIVITKDSSRYFEQGQKSSSWHKNFYCYEYSVSDDANQKAERKKEADKLNIGLGLYGHIERRKASCFVLKKLVNNIKSIQYKKLSRRLHPSFVLQNEPLTILMQQLNSQLVTSSYKPIFLDETGFTGKINLTLYANIYNIDELNKELQSYGLTLIPALRELDMFVLTEFN